MEIEKHLEQFDRELRGISQLSARDRQRVEKLARDLIIKILAEVKTPNASQ